MGGGLEVVVTTPFIILTISCLTFCLLLTNRHILGLPECKLKVVNICGEMHGTGGREVVVSDRFQQYVQIVRQLMQKSKSLSFHRFG